MATEYVAGAKAGLLAGAVFGLYSEVEGLVSLWPSLAFQSTFLVVVTLRTLWGLILGLDSQL